MFGGEGGLTSESLEFRVRAKCTVTADEEFVEGEEVRGRHELRVHKLRRQTHQILG